MISKSHRWLTGLAFVTVVIVLFRSIDYDNFTSRATSQSTLPEVNWSRFAYTQYVTDSAYLCNSVMFFEALHRLSSRADRIMMYPSEMLQPEKESAGDLSNDARLLLKARDEYKVNLIPITVQSKPGEDQTWAQSFTKLLAFNQTQYSRVLSIDSDSMLFQDMDELFLIPPAPVAMPRAYWLYPDKEILSSQVMLIQPSKVEFSRIMDKIKSSGRDDYDMEIVNYLYGKSASIFPHRRYDMLTAEFRQDEHTRYLGSDSEPWDPVAVYNELKLIHFSDWPIPKPWIPTPKNLLEELQPKCINTTTANHDCAARDIWNSIYSDFRQKRKEVCDLQP